MAAEDGEGIGLLSGAPPAPPLKKTETEPAAAPVPTPAAPAPPPPKPQVSAVLSLKAAEDSARAVTAGTVTTLSAVLSSKAPDSLTIPIGIEVAYTSTYPGEGAEWPVHWTPPGKRTSSELFARKVTQPVTILPGAGVPLSFEITAPVGVRYGDRVEIRLTVHDPDGSPALRLTLAAVARQAVLAIKTSRGYEREVADTLHARTDEKADVVFALLVPSS
ncbi:MAG: hypothetical protein ACREEC_09780, partial [Thermoplasmata archaeon]